MTRQLGISGRKASVQSGHSAGGMYGRSGSRKTGDEEAVSKRRGTDLFLYM